MLDIMHIKLKIHCFIFSFYNHHWPSVHTVFSMMPGQRSYNCIRKMPNTGLPTPGIVRQWFCINSSLRFITVPGFKRGCFTSVSGAFGLVNLRSPGQKSLKVRELIHETHVPKVFIEFWKESYGGLHFALHFHDFCTLSNYLVYDISKFFISVIHTCV